MEVLLAHSGNALAPPDDLSAWAAVGEFWRYGAKHILLGYDHLLFLAGLALLARGLSDVVAVIAIFALAYSTTLIGGTLLEVEAPGETIDAIIAVSSATSARRSRSGASTAGPISWYEHRAQWMTAERPEVVGDGDEGVTVFHWQVPRGSAPGRW